MNTRVGRLGAALILLAGAVLSVGVILLLFGPLSWWSFYGSWPGDGEDVGVALADLVALVAAPVVWLIGWALAWRRSGRGAVLAMLVAALLVPVLFSAWSFTVARNDWCRIRQANGPDERLRTVGGLLAPHC